MSWSFRSHHQLWQMMKCRFCANQVNVKSEQFKWEDLWELYYVIFNAALWTILVTTKLRHNWDRRDLGRSSPTSWLNHDQLWGQTRMLRNLSSHLFHEWRCHNLSAQPAPPDSTQGRKGLPHILWTTLVLICVCCLSASHLSPWLHVLSNIPVDPGGFCHVPPEPSLLPAEPASVPQPLFMEQMVQPQSSWLPLLNSSLFTAASCTEGLKLVTIIHVT